MAADFVQVPELPELLEMPDIVTSYSQGQDVKVTSDVGRVVTMHCGEPVKPGVGPGVLIGDFRFKHQHHRHDNILP